MPRQPCLCWCIRSGKGKYDTRKHKYALCHGQHYAVVVEGSVLHPCVPGRNSATGLLQIFWIDTARRTKTGSIEQRSELTWSSSPLPGSFAMTCLCVPFRRVHALLTTCRVWLCDWKHQSQLTQAKHPNEFRIPIGSVRSKTLELESLFLEKLSTAET